MTMIAYPPPSGFRGRLYLAASLGTFTPVVTPHYASVCHAVRAWFPAATLIEARTAFTSNADWLARWPGVLATLAGLVFLADDDGYIGRGVLREVMDAEATVLPVWYCDDGSALHPRDALTIRTDPYGDWRHFATVAPAAGVH